METTFTVEYDPLFSARVPHTRTLLIEADVNDTPHQISRSRKLAASPLKSQAQWPLTV